MPFTILRQDITRMKVDALVNAANTDLQRGGGVCGAIFKAAGEEKLAAACHQLGPIKTGEAVITPGFALLANYIIHTAGPVFNNYPPQESRRLLRLCYTNSLNLAISNHCRSIAFPLISSGIYGYPKGEALQVATEAIGDFLNDHEMDVYLAVFEREAFGLSKKLMGDIASYIDDHYVQSHLLLRSILRNQAFDAAQSLPYEEQFDEEVLSMPLTSASFFDSLAKNLDESFSDALMRLIDQKGKTDVETYKKANLDRKLFSKIRTGKGYMPGKRTVLALAIALELSEDETENLLARAGFALSPSLLEDVIVEYFIKNRLYNIFDINQVLFRYDRQLLGG